MSATDQPPPYPGDEQQISYPGRMLTYPGFTRGQPPIFVHDCVQGCPQMPFRPGQPGYIAPPKGMMDPPVQIPPPPGKGSFINAPSCRICDTTSSSKDSSQL